MLSNLQHWRFLLTWSPDSYVEFPQWVPWALLFTLPRPLP